MDYPESAPHVRCVSRRMMGDYPCRKNSGNLLTPGVKSMRRILSFIGTLALAVSTFAPTSALAASPSQHTSTSIGLAAVLDGVSQAFGI